jgi:hypothetical protein
MKRGIGSHTKPGNGIDTVWLTPPEILWALGGFDLDPCACADPRPYPTAAKHIAPPEDGLAAKWEGRVWLNPPYGNEIGQWMEKMSEHRIGTALTFARTETDWWRRWVWPYAKALLFIYGRLTFHLPDGTESRYNAGGPSVLIAYSSNDADHLWLSGIQGAYVEVKRT